MLLLIALVDPSFWGPIYLLNGNYRKDASGHSDRQFGFQKARSRANAISTVTIIGEAATETNKSIKEVLAKVGYSATIRTVVEKRMG